jgi:hypothetical protein
MGSDIAGFRDRNAAGCIDQGKLLGLLLGIASLAGRHGECSGKQPGDSSQHDDAGLGHGSSYAHDQAGIGDETVIHPEHAGAQRAAAKIAMLPPHIFDGLGPGMPGRRCRCAAIDRYAAHLGG